MLLIVKKKETFRHNGEYINFGAAIKCKSSVEEELISQPMIVEESIEMVNEELPNFDFVKPEELTNTEEQNKEIKNKSRKRGDKKSFLFSENWGEINGSHL